MASKEGYLEVTDIIYLTWIGSRYIKIIMNNVYKLKHEDSIEGRTVLGN